MVSGRSGATFPAMLGSFKLLPLILSLGLVACAPSFHFRPAGPATLSVTPVQLISQAGALQGQRVTVRGYFTYVTDTRALWESEEAAFDAREQRLGPDVDYWAKCITVYPDGIESRPFDRHSVMVTGNVAIIDKSDIRSLWTCNAVALENAVVTFR
jgi:hypothetical protein